MAFLTLTSIKKKKKERFQMRSKRINSFYFQKNSQLSRDKRLILVKKKISNKTIRHCYLQEKI